ncbi:Sec-independent protein translocase protein TatC [Rickettsiales bacterium Ac37b]|nr:Sec-independent protein translocase protein TatC [Rickettsiales bacterium Ac37b]
MSNFISENQKVSLSVHIAELKKRVVYSLTVFSLCVMICYHFAGDIYNYLLMPLANVLEGDNRKIIYTGLTEAFFTYLKLAIFAGFCISFPFIAMQLYIFLAPGLYYNEKKVLIPYLIASPILFILGAVLVYYLILPVAWKFFLSFETSHSFLLPIQFEARISEYLALVMHLIIAFGIAFQLPIILTLLTKVGLLDSVVLSKKRKLAIVLVFAIAAVITPPDVISQFALAIPMLILYEISILACKWVKN